MDWDETRASLVYHLALSFQQFLAAIYSSINSIFGSLHGNWESFEWQNPSKLHPACGVVEWSAGVEIGLPKPR